MERGILKLYLHFLRARHWDTIKSVSPIRDKAEEIMANECDSDGDNEDIICEPCGGNIVERVSKERDAENVKKMKIVLFLNQIKIILIISGVVKKVLVIYL